MIADLKPYPAMKDSGVGWMGDMPEHWEAKRGKALFHCVDVRSSTGEEELLTVSSEHGVVPRSSATVTMFKAESYVGYKLCWPGDLVINSLWAWGRGLGVSRHHGIISSAYGVYRLRSSYAEYSAYVHELVRSAPFNWELQVRSKGIWISRLQLTDEAFLGAPFPLPPSQEQAAIVRFLDHADRRIRRYIRAKEKLITLLEEQKKALIHRAVTGGLDPNVRLKPSGVEWLGDVPKHWEVNKVTRLFSIGSGSTPPTEHSEYYGGGIPWVTTSELREAVVGSTKKTITEEALKAFPTLNIYPEGSIVIAMYGATIGRLGILGVPAAVNQACCVFSAPNGMYAWFWFYWFQSKRRYLISLGYGGGQPNLSQELLKSLRVPTPSFAEQRTISAYLDKATSDIADAVNRAHREIDLLREYHTRLIADVVTGKLDVRESAAQLPDEVEEQELLDETDALIDGDGAADDLDTTPEEAAV